MGHGQSRIWTGSSGSRKTVYKSNVLRLVILLNAQNMLLSTYFSFFFILSGRFGTKNSAVYSMRGTLQYRFTTARVQWPCSTDIHWACLITQSGPARYVPSKRYNMRYELTRSGERVTGSGYPLLPTLRTSHGMAKKKEKKPEGKLFICLMITTK